MLWFLLACGPTYEDGMIARGELNCELLAACDRLDEVGADSVKICKQRSAAQDYDEADCPGYNPRAMQACIDAYQAAVDATDCDADLVVPCFVCD